MFSIQRAFQILPGIFTRYTVVHEYECVCEFHVSIYPVLPTSPGHLLWLFEKCLVPLGSILSISSETQSIGCRIWGASCVPRW